jgi:hypothetical protein
MVKASPLIVLGRINHLFLFQHLAEEIVVSAPPPVIIAWNLSLGESLVLSWAYQNPG